MKKLNLLVPLGLLSLIILLLSLSYPSTVISAQSQDEDPDFIVTLTLMAVADDRLDGVMYGLANGYGYGQRWCKGL